MADEVLAKLRGTRRVYLRHVENSSNEVNSILETFLSDDNIDNTIRLNTLKAIILSKISEIKKLDEKILAELNEKDSEEELNEILLREDKHLHIITKIDFNILSKQAKKCEDTSVNNEISIDSSIQNREKVKVHLPKLEIEKFDGDVTNWSSFWDQFSSAIHENDSLNEITKFNYLKTFLCDSAKLTIHGLQFTSENYKEAINLLKERYGNTQVLINAFMRKFVRLPSVDSKNVESLRLFYDNVETSVRNLKTLGVEVNTYGSLLIPLLNEKLPDGLRLRIARNFENDVWDLSKMLTLIKTELEAKERSTSMFSTSSSEFEFSTSALFVKSFKNANKKACVFCNKNNHASFKCLKVSDPKVRISILRRKKLCFICFNEGHLSSNCLKFKDYNCKRCSGKHNISVCSKPADPLPGPPTAPTVVPPATPIDESNNGTTLTNFNNKNILLQTAVAKLSAFNSNKTTDVRMIFDTGSQKTYVTNEVRNFLQLPTLRTENIFVNTFGNHDTKPKTVDVVPLKFIVNGKVIVIEALCSPCICSDIFAQNVSKASRNFSHLQNLQLADPYDNDRKKIDILIGLDVYFKFMTGKIRRGNEFEPVALESCFGWVLSGYYESPFSTNNSSFTNLRLNTSFNDVDYLRDNDTVFKLEKETFFNIDNDKCEPTKGRDFIKNFEDNLVMKNNRYETKLPVKDNLKDMLPDNYLLAVHRLKGLRNRLNKDKDLMIKYDTIFREYLENNIIETVDITSTENEIIHYLPHHPVIRDDKETTKIRIVFDASSKLKSQPSLNDILFPGPCLLPLLQEVLLRFRIGKIGLIADIKQAFLQIWIDPNHRDFVRFLWFDDIYKDNPKIVILRFCRVLFGLTCSPFILNGTINAHLEKFSDYANLKDFIYKFIRDLYVDDVSSSFDNIDNAYSFYKNASSILALAQFNLRKWDTNDNELKNRIKLHSNLENVDKIPDVNDDVKIRKVLGVSWDTFSDKFIFDFKEIATNGLQLAATKRNILKICNTFFDPLGLLSPIVLQVKLIFKELCINKYEWDTDIDNDIKVQWNELLKDLLAFRAVSVRRHVLCCTQRDVEIHGFCDSSAQAYCAVVYVRVECSHGVSVNLWAGKCRLAPMKKLTIAQLELLSCLLLAKLVKTVVKAVESEVNVKKVLCWSDSQIAIWWILGYYTPTNPADISTKKVKLS